MNNPLFRPPAEADSLILQIDQGCPHNLCTFCGMYKAVRFRQRAIDEACKLIEREARRAPGTRRVFLADGDVMRRPFEDLERMLRVLGQHLPRLARVSLYANGSSIAAKSPAELGALQSLKLHTLYMGLESGDESILQSCRKGETAETMVRAGVMAGEAGLRMSVMVLLGLGGTGHTAEHAANTAAAINRMQPRLLSALRVVPIEGTALYKDTREGRFNQLTEHGVVEELRGLVAGLELTGTVFRANHASNVVPVEARFPRDKQRLLQQLDTLLASGQLDRESAGRMPLWL